MSIRRHARAAADMAAEVAVQALVTILSLPYMAAQILDCLGGKVMAAVRKARAGR